MKNKKKSLLKSSPGLTSTILLVLAVVLIIVIIIVFFVIRANTAKNTNPSKTPDQTANNEPPKPVYEAEVGDVKFIVQSAQNLGSDLIDTKGYGQSLHSTEKIIKVTIGAQNKSKINVGDGAWEIGNIIDSDGRNFVSIDNQAYIFLPDPNLCGTLLKPEFKPVPCVKFYEVSKASTKLKIQVSNMPSSGIRKQEAMLDLNVTP